MDDSVKNTIVELSIQVFKRYSFTFFSEEEKSIIFEKVLKNDIKDSKCIKKLLEDEIKYQISRKLPDVDIINNYLNRKQLKKSSEGAIEFINHLDDFCKKFHCSFDEDFALELLKNNKNLYWSVGIYFNLNKELIIQGNIKELTSSLLKITLLKAYALFEGIIIEEKCNDDSSFYQNDAYKEYCSEVSKNSILTFEEEQKLFAAWRNGDQSARQKIINSNLRYVISIAKNYVKTGVPILDLIQEGNVGLIRAMDYFDETRGYRFLTYASWSINQQMLLFIKNSSRVIRVPVNKQEKMLAYKKQKENLESKYNRELTNDEISRLLTIPISDVDEYENLLLGTISLNYLIDDETELGEFIASEEESVEEKIIRKESKQAVNKLFELARLNEREIEIIKLIYGFDDDNPKTLQYVANIYNITRSRVAQILKRSLFKLNRVKNMLYENTDNFDLSIPRENKHQSAYERFKNYSKEDIDYAIYFLPEEEREIFLLYNSKQRTVDYIQTNKYYQVVLPHLRKILTGLKIKPERGGKGGK